MADIKIFDFYKEYIRVSKNKLKDYVNNLNKIEQSIDEVKIRCEENKDKLKEKFNIDADDILIDDNVYNKLFKFYKIAIDDDKDLLLMYIKYKKLIDNQIEHLKEIQIKEKECNLTFSKYQELVANYFKEVHKTLLKGRAYKFGNELGIIVIIRYSYGPNDKKPNKIVDFRATNKAKEELRKKGIKVYTYKEILDLRKQGIDIGEQDYVKYRSDDSYCKFRFINHRAHKGELTFKHTEYINPKYKGISHEEICEKFVTREEDIYDMQVDIKVKLNLLLIHNPNNFVNFIHEE